MRDESGVTGEGRVVIVPTQSVDSLCRDGSDARNICNTCRITSPQIR